MIKAKLKDCEIKDNRGFDMVIKVKGITFKNILRIETVENDGVQITWSNNGKEENFVFSGDAEVELL